ncbi:MAG: LapA family protein [Alphaproteobacteria bacterium]
MKYLGWIIVVALAAVLGVFAIHNHQAISLDLWPLPVGEVKVAAFVLVLVAAFVGFVLGGLCAWIGGAASRRASREKARALSATRRELEETRARLPAPPARA